MMHSKIFSVLAVTLVFGFASDVEPYKILGIFPFAAPSHYFLGNELMKGLAEAGHDATILTVFEEKNPPKNGKYRQILMPEVYEKEQAMFSKILNFSEKTSGSFFLKPLKIFTMLNAMTNISQWVLEDPNAQKLMTSNEKFDVVIVTQFTVEALKALAPHFNSHLVIFNNNAANSWMNAFVGNPTLPSLNPEIISGFPPQMNFKQRLINTLINSAMYLNIRMFQYPSQADVVHKYISKDIDLDKVQYNVSLVLSNSHSSLNPPASSVPCMKEIGGFHVKPPKPLPEDLKKYLDGAKNGVIYFSLGSNVKSSAMSDTFKIAVMKAFAKRKEDILWKFEMDDLPGKPDNVRIEKWLPQSDLLAHPNIKLFITHGGYLSTIETLYHGVPTVAMPILGDQLQNARQAERNGFTKVIDFNSLTEESLSEAIKEVLSNNKYRENVKIRSKIFHDRQIKPMEEAVYWLEYIVRHNGAKHLRVGYLDLSWYQYYLLDVFAFIFLIVFSVLFVTKKIFCWILRKIFKKRSGPTTKTSKKIKKQ